MFRQFLVFGMVSLASATSAFAQDQDFARIREELKELRDRYERRIEDLERRLAQAESKFAANAPAAGRAEPVATPARGGGNAFNPDISLILQGTLSGAARDPNQYQITGFVPSGGEVGPPKRGFGLAETELVMSASIDPYLRGAAIASLAPDGGVQVEEAYFQTQSLPDGFTAKGGRFFSALGYLNEQHQHAWDFQDAPLPYRAFLGGKLRQDGLQLKWVAPTDLFLELGAELSAGDRFPGNDRNKNGIGGSAVFAHAGGDIGASLAWRAGASLVRTSANARSYDDTDSLGGNVTNTFTGNARLWALDAVLKWAPNGNATQTNFKLQGEYLRLRQDGELAYNDSAQAAPQFGTPFRDGFRSAQSGWYVQGVWQFYPRWRIGYRHDALSYGRVNIGIVDNGSGPRAADFPVLAAYSPKRNTMMFDFSASEFSRFRLQYALDNSRIGPTDRQWLLQYIHSLGAHGAHKF